MAEPEEPAQRAHPVRRAMMIALLFTGLATAFFALWVIHWLVHPWAVSLPGKPGLVGYWHGEVRFAQDDTRRIVLDLNGDPPMGRGTLIDGVAKVCGGPHRMSYVLDGDTHNRSGTRFWLDPSVDNYDPGVYLYRMTGEWDLADLVTIDATLATFTADDNDPPERTVRFHLHRSSEDEFDATCEGPR